MKKSLIIWIIGGTTEARKLIDFLSMTDAKVYVSVATEYGKSIIKYSQNVEVNDKRLSKYEMISFISDVKPHIVIDATHPYAKLVSENAYKACEGTKVRYIRLKRDESLKGDFIYVKSTLDAVEIVKETDENIFLTCGSKEIEHFTNLNNYKQRVYARVLPMCEVIKKCEDLGFERKNMIYMQGPFSKEINLAMFKHAGAKVLITKDSGDAGGFTQKIEAAQELGIKIIVIGRPIEISGFKFEEVIKKLQNEYYLKIEDKNKEVIPYFPMFISIRDKKVRVFGGGNIAKRRIKTLIDFGAKVNVVAPLINNDVANLVEDDKIKVERREYKKGDCNGYEIIIAATNDKDVNDKIYKESKDLNVYLNISDNKNLCTFFFPAVIKKDNMVIGVTSSGVNHKHVKEVADRIRAKAHDIF